MQTTTFNTDIRVACVKAASFPEGVLAAHQKLHNLVTFSEDRKFFGISFPVGKGQIEYMAAVEEPENDTLFDESFERFIIKKGIYLVIVISDFRKNIPAIGHAFQQLITSPDIDPQGACIEWYPNMTDVHCMVRLADH